MRTLLTIRPLDGEPRRLIIDGDHFVEPSGSFDQELDTGRWWAVPGLADCHAHLAADSPSDMARPGDLDHVRRRAFAQLAAGIFVVIDKGWSDETVLRLLGDPLEGRPHLEAAGRMVATRGGYYQGFADEVDPGELPAAVARAARAGGWVKIIGDWPRKGRGAMANFPEDALTEAVDAAHRVGLRVAIHTLAAEVPGMAVRAGVDSIEHGIFLTAGDVASFGQRRGCWVPTISNVEALVELLGTKSSGGRLLAQGLNNLRRVLPLAGETGVTVLTGTDLGIPHGRVAVEATRLSAYGLTADRAVEAATTNAYRYLGIPYGFEPGMRADVVFLAEDPREDLTTLERPVSVIRRGSLVGDADRVRS